MTNAEITALREKIWGLDEPHQLRQVADDIIDLLEAELKQKGSTKPFLYAVVKENMNIGFTKTLGDADFMSLQHGGVVIPLYINQPNPVVVLPQRYSPCSLAGQGIAVKDSTGDYLNYQQVVIVLSSVGIVVKDGESDQTDITCYSCRKKITREQHMEADGFCPYCEVEIELDDE